MIADMVEAAADTGILILEEWPPKGPGGCIILFMLLMILLGLVLALVTS